MNSINYFIQPTYSSCSQGQLVISRDETNARTYLHCEECEMGRLHPIEIDKCTPGFLTLTNDFDAHTASMEEITQANWQSFVSGSFYSQSCEWLRSTSH
jgi:hypothetical protein